jgi:hypothetical protein
MEDTPGPYPAREHEGQERELPPHSTVKELTHAAQVFTGLAKEYLPVSLGGYLGIGLQRVLQSLR